MGSCINVLALVINWASPPLIKEVGGKKEKVIKKEVNIKKGTVLGCLGGAVSEVLDSWLQLRL